MPQICRQRCGECMACSPCPPLSRQGWTQEVRQGIMMADAAKQAGIAHYVYTSVGSAHRNTGIPHFETKWKVEQHIRQIGLPVTILRPVWFMENFTTFSKPSAEGILMMPMRADKKLAMVALRDIGEFGAAAFMRPHDFVGQAIDLAGDELTMPESAAQLSSKSTGRSIRSRRSHWSKPKPRLGHDLATMFRWFNEVGYADQRRRPKADIRNSAHHVCRVE